MSVRLLSLLVASLLATLASIACTDFVPEVGPFRATAAAPDCGASGNEYDQVDAGMCGEPDANHD